MQKAKEPWHVLTMICPECGNEFQPKILTQRIRLCPTCERKSTRPTLVARIAPGTHAKQLFSRQCLG
jgi:ribosomal protein L37AE/L43A